MTIDFSPHPTAIASLRKRWIWTALLCVAWITAGFLLLQGHWRTVSAFQWLALSAAGVSYLLWILWRGLEHNRRAGEKHLLSTLGLGNQLTLLRGALTAALAGFLFSPRPDGWLAWIPGCLYTLAALIDLFDGYAARRTNHATHLGEMLDLSLDGTGVLIAGVLAVQYRQVAPWYLLVAFARYLFIGGIWFRKRRGLPVYDLPPSPTRRPFAGTQMGFIAVILWPLISPPITQVAAVLFALPFLAGFGLDWLEVSGAKAGTRIRMGRFTGLQHTVTSRLPVLLRAIAVTLLAVIILSDVHDGVWPPRVLTGQVSSSPFLWMLAIFMLQGIGGVLLALGAAGRIASLAILFSRGLLLHFASVTPADILLILCSAGLFFLGTGAYSLWKPEDRLIYRRLGEA
jgi:CDP-diacylglycerol--glycerol-3-phosphate 3-phosphatidyltransferase